MNGSKQGSINKKNLRNLAPLISNDVADQRRAQKALRESNDRYRTLFDLAPVAIYSCDASGVIQEYNKRAAELWGRRPEPGDTDERFCGSFKMYRPDGTFMPHEQCPMGDVLSGNVPGVRDGEVHIERPDGSRIVVVVNIGPQKDERGKIIGAINCFYDVTERKREQEAKARLAAIVESSQDAIIAKDLSGMITNWNKAAERIFGYTEQETIGQPIMMVIPPELREEERAILARLRNGERIEHFETTRRRKDGSRFPVSLTISPIRNEDNQVIGASKILRDITERKQAELALQKAKDELESRVEERTRELQNQVSETKRAEQNLRALTGRLLQIKDEERRHIARELHDSVGQNLAALSMNLSSLQWAKPETDRFTKRVADSRLLVDCLIKDVRTISHLLHPPLLDEAGLGSALRLYVEGFSQRSGIQVELELEPDFGRLSKDLEIVIFRLVQEGLTNIHRHSGSPSARICILRSETRVDIKIQDKGKGISPERQNELVMGKAGVGMRGMQERVRQLEGTFEITSNSNGTCLAVTLPITQEAGNSMA